MHAEPQDEQPTLPDRRGEEPLDPSGDGSGASSSGPAGAAPLPTRPVVPEAPALSESPSGAMPPRMPAPPQMPAGGRPPSAWSSPPAAPLGPPSSETLGVGAFEGQSIDGAQRDDAQQKRDGTQQTARVYEAGPSDLSADPADPFAAAEPVEDPGATVIADAPVAPPAAAPVAQGDWLASVCPYLASEDGTYRSAAPDEGHRCTAQDPAATLPLAFQERFCLTDRHPRCEMYKFAQETDSAGAIPASQVPPTQPPTSRTSSSTGGRPSRPVLLTAAGIGGVIVLMVLLTLVMGSCSGDGGAGDDPEATLDPQATEAPAATPQRTAKPTPEPEPTPTPEPDPDATPADGEAAEGETIVILYEIQPDEALLKISETFGVSRNRLRRANPGLEELTPAELPGTTIEIPIIGQMTLEEAALLDGYVGIAP